ncbi:hypothetical protein BDV34DRAFT_203423 [Aspergillus parasiticus]|uniref:Uncharacterized protein n=1 Tax=Aspergillus parasiticus TaxID=5067 RepID=A0A5N6D826_ASPPA|nr:hypothetical protein BDV34DRAFT_203423 [Aspergillus parasiticus]
MDFWAHDGDWERWSWICTSARLTVAEPPKVSTVDLCTLDTQLRTTPRVGFGFRRRFFSFLFSFFLFFLTSNVTWCGMEKRSLYHLAI